MSTQLTFQNTALTAIQRNNQTYISSIDLANALGYARCDAIARIYERNADEFTSDMTLNVKLTVKGFGNGNSEKTVRIFSLRGAHLIAMFSRTAVAKDFRKWVLDILDRETKQLPLPEPDPTVTIELKLSELKKLVTVWLQFTRFSESVGSLIKALGLNTHSFQRNERSVVFNQALCEQNIRDTVDLVKDLSLLIPTERKRLE